MKAIGYVGSASPDRKPAPVRADWMHSNAVAYNAELDQVLLNVLEFNEFWIIDHSTTTAEAAGHTGGKHGKGGDLLYRWGNPRALSRRHDQGPEALRPAQHTLDSQGLSR